MKILIIPDVHGRSNWRKPCEDMSQWDKVIFLGDYLDPYPGEATNEEALAGLKDIVALKEIYKDKVILLWGNHDLPYWCDIYRNQLDYWCRHDYRNHDEIESIFVQHNSLFQWAWQYGKYLFTHAGINNGFAKLIGEKYEKVNAEVINEFFNEEINQLLLAMVSFYRGGYERFSSPVWADVHEHCEDNVSDYVGHLYQIFGHTYSSQRIITEKWAMLDIGGPVAYLEDDKLRDINGNELKLTEL